MKYTFVFRNCDIVPEISRQTNEWTECPITAALNEVLLIDPRLDVKWTILEEEEDEAAWTYTVVVETDANEAMIKQKYEDYKRLRGLGD